MANGIGGDLFAIVYEAKSGKLYWAECQRMVHRGGKAHSRFGTGE
jgi:hypothetical protein